MRKKCGCGVRVWHIGSDYHLQQVVSRDTSVHCKLTTSGSPCRAMIHNMIMFVITIKVLMVMAAIMFFDGGFIGHYDSECIKVLLM